MVEGPRRRVCVRTHVGSAHQSASARLSRVRWSEHASVASLSASLWMPVTSWQLPHEAAERALILCLEGKNLAGVVESARQRNTFESTGANVSGKEARTRQESTCCMGNACGGCTSFHSSSSSMAGSPGRFSHTSVRFTPALTSQDRCDRTCSAHHLLTHCAFLWQTCLRKCVPNRSRTTGLPHPQP